MSHFKKLVVGGAIPLGVASLLLASQVWAGQAAANGPAQSAGKGLQTAPSGRRPAAKRTILSVVVLDALNTDWNSQIQAREAVKTMIETLPPGNRIAIFALGDRLHMLHDFSTDRAALLAEVDNYPGEQPFWWVGSRDNSTSALAAQYPSWEAAPWSWTSEYRAGEYGIDGYGYEYRPDEYGLGQYRFGAAFAQEQRIVTTFEAMNTLAQIMGHASGRNYLLWISSGFPLTWYPPEGVQAIQAMNKARLALYAIDPRGVLQNFEAQSNIDTMKTLTEQTGGRTFYNSNDTGALLRIAMAVLSNEE